MSIQEPLTERVARGAAWLDEVRPGWRDAINLGTLDLQECSLCVLGQVFAASWSAQSNEEDGYDHGVNLSGTVGYPDQVLWSYAHGFDERNSDYDALGAEWKRVIHAERAKDAPLDEPLDALQTA